MASRRLWKVIAGYPDLRCGDVTFEPQHNGIPDRSFATEARARAAAHEMVNGDSDGNHFAAARLWGPGWPIGDVDEYRPDQPVRRINTIEEARKDVALWESTRRG